MTVPDRFIGAWERAELCIDGRPVADAGRAVWVQAGRAFVDVRGAGGFASDTCFAGTTSWAEPYLTWTHTIDRASDDQHADRGHITFDGEDLIEEGEAIAGMAVSYRERWRRLPGPPAPVSVVAEPSTIAVRVGYHAAAVVDARPSGRGFSARCWRLVEGSWQTELAVGDDTAVAPPTAP